MANHILLFTLLSLRWSGSEATAFPLLRVPVGPRPCAMGESFTGLANDANAIFWNPAGLGQVGSVQLSCSHQEWFGGIRDENVGLIVPFGPGSLGLGAVYSTTNDVEVWDPETGGIKLMTARSGYAAAGYGIRLCRPLHLGFSVKGLYDDLIEETGSGLCGDIGLLWRLSRTFRVGVAALNLGWGMRYGGENYRLPSSLRFGASVENARLRLLFDGNAGWDNLPDGHIGGEYLMNNIISLRGGYRLGPQDWRTLSWWSGITGGLGVTLGNVTLDYAFVPYGRLGATHRIAIHTTFAYRQFGKIKIQVREAETGLPVNAKFILEGTQQGTSYTEVDGTFVIEGVESGWLKVTVLADRFYPQTESVLVEPRMTHVLRIQLQKTGFGSLWGGVYSAENRRPLPARVGYFGPDSGLIQTSGTEGSFTLRRLRCGFYNFIVTPLDTLFQPARDTVTIQPGRLVSRTFLLATRWTLPVSTDSGGVVPDTTPPPFDSGKWQDFDE
ncbi:MAG: PorV/PorQ family protein [candidate division WOR-3 bacterium]